MDLTKQFRFKEEDKKLVLLAFCSFLHHLICKPASASKLEINHRISEIILVVQFKTYTEKTRPAVEGEFTLGKCALIECG